MKVITGTARGMKLVTLDGEDVRPTGEKVKEAVFSSIQFEIEGRMVLDLFAGSGALGIEALSRGAKGCVFCDMNRNALNVVKGNLDHTKLRDKATTLYCDAFSYLARCGGREKFGVIFIDPPYHNGLAQRAVIGAEQALSPGGVIVCETAADEEMPETAGRLVLSKSARYGKTRIWYYRTGGTEQ